MRLHFSNTPGRSYKIAFWDATGPGGSPGNLIWESPVNLTTNLGYNNIVLPTPVAINAGDFYAGVRQVVSASSIFLSYQKELAQAINKSPAEISKWVSGLHNLTLKSIVKLEMALETHLIMTETVAKEKFDPSGVKMISFGKIPHIDLEIPQYTGGGEKNPMKVVYKKAS